MPIKTTAFAELEMKLNYDIRQSGLDILAVDKTRPTCVIVTREDCSDCESFEKSLPYLESKYGDTVTLERVHVTKKENDSEYRNLLKNYPREDQRAKRKLQLTGYPTVAIYIPSPMGPLQSYWDTEPSLEVVEKQLEKAISRFSRH